MLCFLSSCAQQGELNLAKASALVGDFSRPSIAPMDLQVDTIPICSSQDFPKLREGERVEVRQKDVGLRGSWHSGTIVGLKAGRRLVEYDELLAEDGIQKLRESIPCSKFIEKPGICFPAKSNGLVVTPTRSPSKRRGLLRPCPPPRTEPLPLTWKSGLFVDVFYQDAWWEAVLLNDVTSLDDDALVNVIFPDEGDQARVHAKNMRISQCWDEVTGDWTVKGSLDLSKFLKRRGIEKKEVTLTADFDCRTSEVVSNFIHNEMDLNNTEWTQNDASLVFNIKDEASLRPAISGLLTCKEVTDKFYNNPSPSEIYEQVMPDRSSTDESTVQSVRPVRVSGDGGVTFDRSGLEYPLETSSCGGRSEKLSCEEPHHTETCHGGSLCGNDIETIGLKSDSMGKEDVAECRQSSCWKATEAQTVEEKSVQGGLFFKRRKVGSSPRNSYDRVLPNSQPVLPAPSHNASVETLKVKMIHENLCSATGEWSERAPNEERGCLNLKDSKECSSPIASNGTDMRLSFGLKGSTPFKKQLLSSTDTFGHSNRSSTGIELARNVPVRKMCLLALEAPVRKLPEEYEQMVLEGRVALLGGLHSGRQGGKVSTLQKLQEECCRVTLAEKRRVEGVALEMRIRRPRTKARKNVPVCAKNSNVSCFQSTTVGPRLKGVALDRASTSERRAGEVPAEKPFGEDVQSIHAAKVSLPGTAHEKRIRIKRGASAILRSVCTSQESGRNETLSSFKDHLVRQKKGKGLKRKMSNLSSMSEADGKNVKLRKLLKLDRELNQADAGTMSCLSDREDCVAARREPSERIKLLRASNPAERTVSCLSHSGGINALKRKASKTSFMLKHSGENGSKPERVPNQSEASDFFKSKVKKMKKTGGKSLKKLAQEIGKEAVLEAGFTIDYRPRNGKLSFDAVYTSPKGSSYWSLPKAWQALGNEKKKGRMKVQKALIQQVLSKIYEDDTLRLAFESLDRFSGTCLQEVMSRANMTYAELTDVLILDLQVLKKTMVKSKKKSCTNEAKLDKNQLGRRKAVKADLKASLLASVSSTVRKRGRKQMQEADTVSGEADSRLLTHKVYSRLKHVQGGSSRKVNKKKSSFMEGRPFDSRRAPNKSGSSSINRSLEKRRNSSKGTLQKGSIEAGNLKQESLQETEKSLKPRAGLRLEVRPSSSCMDDGSELSCQSKRTVISWMISRGAISESEKILYEDQLSREVLKEGLLRREGILCRCCKRIYTVESFKDHGGSQERRPHCELRFASGKTFLDCQLDAWNTEIQLRKTHNYKGVSANDTNDDTCLLCGDGGVLLCCDFCPSTFHASCLQLEIVPDGNWYCPKCRCGVCKGTDGFEEQAVCSQCEHRYHIACLQGGHTILWDQFLCGVLCRKIFSGLKNLIGISHPLGKGFSWTLLHCIEKPQTEDLKIATENNSKLAVALLVLKECFNPMDDPRTNIDMIIQATYNRRSQFCRLNYVGFYTVVLERDDEIISVATIRIHGARVAEMPLIGTRHKHRRQGMCRLLVGAIEKLLSSLEVANFILPAISELYDTWTQAFGFRPLNLNLRSEIKDISMMMFPGTDLLFKSLSDNPAVANEADHC